MGIDGEEKGVGLETTAAVGDVCTGETVTDSSFTGFEFKLPTISLICGHKKTTDIPNKNAIKTNKMVFLSMLYPNIFVNSNLNQNTLSYEDKKLQYETVKPYH